MSRRLPRRPGRRSLLTPEVERRLLDAVEAGTPVTYAATAAGIGPATFHRWMARGEVEQDRVDDGETPDQVEEPYRRLRERVVRARAAVAVTNVEVVRKVAEGGYVLKERTRKYRDPVDGQIVTETETDYAPPDWRAASWLLERSFRDFTRAAQVEVTGAAGGPVQVEHGVTPEVADIAARLQELATRTALPAAAGVIEGEVISRNGHANGHLNGGHPNGSAPPA